MKIKLKDFYYGVALTQIAEYPTFTSINKIGRKEGLFEINDSKRILIKYSTIEDVEEWTFTFQKNDIEELTSSRSHEYFVVLVCAGYSVCLLNQRDFSVLMDMDQAQMGSQWIHVTYKERGQLWVNGSLGKLSHAIPHNKFPEGIFFVSKPLLDECVWPPFSRLHFYRNNPRLMLSSMDRALDLSDYITRFVTSREDSTVYFGLSTISHEWRLWDESHLKTIEDLAMHDLKFYGFDVQIERVSSISDENHDVFCSEEFIWKFLFTVSFVDDDDDNDGDCIACDIDKKEDESFNDPQIEEVDETMLNIVSTRKKSVSSVEIDFWNITHSQYKDGEHESLIKRLIAKWVKEKSYSKTGTVWVYVAPSVNFNHQGMSAFYAILGMPKDFRTFLGRGLTVLGKQVRTDSDYVIPDAEEGWDSRIHIENKKVWERVDAAFWQEFKA